jgi:hypothetical protein
MISPIVVFTSKADLKKLNVTSHVVYSPGLIRTIRKYTEENISISDIDRVTNLILSTSIDDRAARKEHVSRIQENEKISKKRTEEVCPWCGGHLVERKGKYGKFNGCSNYPKCRYILKG